MDLKEFIAETLGQIVSGVREAQKSTVAQGAEVSPVIWGIDTKAGLFQTREGRTVAVVDFDVALTAVDSHDKKGGTGIMVGVLGLGVHGATKSESTTVNRVQFRIPVALPGGGTAND